MKPRFARKLALFASVRFAVTAAFLFVVSAHGASTIERRAQGAAQPGFAWTATTRDVPLIHTGQIVGWTAAGKIEGDAAAQARLAIDNLQALLRANASELSHIVKLNLYVTDDAHHDVVAGVIGSAFRSDPVPVSFVRTRLAQPNAVVAVDAVAQSNASGNLPRAASVASLPPAPCGAHLGVLPAGRRVFISGYASRAKEYREGLREVFDLQRQTLAHHGLGPADVVQMKAWFAPYDGLAELKAAVADFFGELPVPPAVLIEWTAANANEIEFVVSGARAHAARFAGPLSFGTRPGVEAPTRFSHVAFVEAGQPLIFTAGFFGRAGDSARQQLQDIYAQLGRALFDAGSGFRYLAKATYHNTDAEGRGPLGEIRDVYYDPARPPAASGVVVRGVGRPGCTATLDIIAVPLPKR